MTKILFIIKHTIDIIFISIKDGFNFIRYTEVLPKKNDRIERLQFQLTVGVHSLEKGLSFKKKKKGFGEVKAIKQLSTLLSYINQGYPTDNYAVLETIAIIEAYIRYKKSVGEFIPEIESLFQKCKDLLNDTQKNYCQAGVDTVVKGELLCTDPIACADLLKKTRSIRNFDKTKKVSEEEILSAISLSRTAPTACNRQPIKVYYSMDDEKNKAVSRIVPGNTGFEDEIPNFLIITSAKNYFGVFEYNQWHVNGGIFLGYLRLALHIVNLGSCIFQWGLRADEKSLRQLCHIPKSEAIVAIVGIGHYAEQSFCIKAQRKSVEEYISKY